MLLYANAYSTALVPAMILMMRVLIAMNLNSLALLNKAPGTMFKEVNSTCIASNFTRVPNIPMLYISTKIYDEKKNIAESTMPIYAENENMSLWFLSSRSFLCIMAAANPKSLKRLKKFESTLVIATMANCSGMSIRARIAVSRRFMHTPEYFAAAKKSVPETSCFFMEFI